MLKWSRKTPCILRFIGKFYATHVPIYPEKLPKYSFLPSPPHFSPQPVRRKGRVRQQLPAECGNRSKAVAKGRVGTPLSKCQTVPRFHLHAHAAARRGHATLFYFIFMAMPPSRCGKFKSWECLSHAAHPRHEKRQIHSCCLANTHGE